MNAALLGGDVQCASELHAADEGRRMAMVGSFDPVAYINEPRWRSSRLGLDRIAELMDRLGNPQDRMHIVHVAGTNGKGSTCAFTASILRSAGFRTGQFSSPYIIRFEDRIRVDGIDVSESDLLSATLEVRKHAEDMEDHPTEFELMTAVALVHFARSACDFAVMEVGLGGRLDSTNVVASPEVCAIAPISFDHTALLGNTLEEIAGEKAGIIKPGAAVVSADQDPAAMRVVVDTCRRCRCDLSVVDRESLVGTHTDFSYREYRHLHIGLLGSYQPENAALAIEIVKQLRGRGFGIDDGALREGLAQARWPGRFEVVAHHPDFIVDGGHNPQGAAVLADSLRQSFPTKRPTFLVGVLQDKDYLHMLQAIVPLGDVFVCIEPPNLRALSSTDLAGAVRSVAAAESPTGHGALKVIAAQDIPQGVDAARREAGPDGLVCAFGSLYSIGDIERALGC
jgi:dihydrofolate synthase/folylpolyglutamate synthase